VADRSARILLVDDEQSIQTLLSYPLRKEGYDVVQATDGRQALDRFDEQNFDLVVLDLMLPKVDGLEVCRRLRSRSAVPIIMLTAKSEEIDKVVGLELGADDYVTKPFSIRELLARIKAVLRRAHGGSQERYAFGDVAVNLRTCQVTRDGKPVEFSAKEFDLLKYFLCHPGEALSRDRLLEKVWGYNSFPTTRTVDAHIVHLRQKLELKPEEPRFILTVHGVGYKFVG